MFTATGTVIPSARHCAICASASRTTRSVSSGMMPEPSASGMNSSGGTKPRAGWFQRINASTPIGLPPTVDTFGW